MIPGGIRIAAHRLRPEPDLTGAEDGHRLPLGDQPPISRTPQWGAGGPVSPGARPAGLGGDRCEETSGRIVSAERIVDNAKYLFATLAW